MLQNPAGIFGDIMTHMSHEALNMGQKIVFFMQLKITQNRSKDSLKQP